jgi:hypothetical protein
VDAQSSSPIPAFVGWFGRPSGAHCIFSCHTPGYVPAFGDDFTRGYYRVIPPGFLPPFGRNAYQMLAASEVFWSRFALGFLPLFEQSLYEI